jgi:two-component system, sensor histidine kinase PdtaS
VDGVDSRGPHPDKMQMQRPPLIDIDVPLVRPGTVGAYVFALVLAAVATALRLAIDPYVLGIQYVTFFPAVIIATFVSGAGAGLFCLALSVAATAFFMMEPRFSFHIENPSDAFTTLLFILVTFTNVILIAGLRYTVEWNEELRRSLEQRDAELRERQERVEGEIEALRAAGPR